MLGKKILILEKDPKARHVVYLMCQKIGFSEVYDAESQKEFDALMAQHVDKMGGLSGLLGPSAAKKTEISLFIVGWDTPTRGIIDFIRELRSRFTGKFNFVVMGEARHAANLGQLMQVGIRNFLIKPFSLADFKEKVEDAILNEPQPIVQSFNLAATSDKSKKAGYGINPFQAPKRKESPPRKDIDASNPFLEKNGGTTPQDTQAKSKTPAAGQMPAGTRIKKGGASFYGSATIRSDTITATLVDGKIDGHYHEKVNIIGGGENCYWAKEIEGDKVRLEYLNAEGKATGIETKVISRDDFMHTFYLCEEHGCQLLKRLGKWPAK